jgi:hypothetical protein
MENLDEITAIMNRVGQAASRMYVDIIAAKNLVDEGKEVICSRKLQGALAQYQTLEREILDYFDKYCKIESIAKE